MFVSSKIQKRICIFNKLTLFLSQKIDTIHIWNFLEKLEKFFKTFFWKPNKDFWLTHVREKKIFNDVIFFSNAESVNYDD